MAIPALNKNKNFCSNEDPCGSSCIKKIQVAIPALKEIYVAIPALYRIYVAIPALKKIHVYIPALNKIYEYVRGNSYLKRSTCKFLL